MRPSAYILRIVHGATAVYFVGCLAYLYVAVVSDRYDGWFWLALVSLGLEGLAVFVLNHGDCPLIYLQRRVGDDKPFFELVLPPRAAKRAIPVLTMIAWLAVALLGLRWVQHSLAI
jgi:hypothetical protein